MNKNKIKAAVSLSILITFVGLGVASSPMTFRQSVETDELQSQVTPDVSARFVALYVDGDTYISPIFLDARFAAFEVPPEPEDSFEEEAVAPRSGNAVRVLSQASFETEAAERGFIQDNAAAEILLGFAESCVCAGYQIITLEHERGIDADLVLKVRGEWDYLEENAPPASVELIPCTDDCQTLGDAFVSDNAESCVFDERRCPVGE